MRPRLSRGTARSRTPYGGFMEQRPAPARRLERGQPCTSQDRSDGGSPEGVAVPRLNSDTPSGPLCFFLRVEKEEVAQRAYLQGSCRVCTGVCSNSQSIAVSERDPLSQLTLTAPPKGEPFGYCAAGEQCSPYGVGGQAQPFPSPAWGRWHPRQRMTDEAASPAIYIPAIFLRKFPPEMKENRLLIRYYWCRRPNFSIRCQLR